MSGGRLLSAERLESTIASSRANATTDPGAWTLDVLRLSERVATDFVQEAAEWSVLYAKEVSDPG